MRVLPLVVVLLVEQALAAGRAAVHWVALVDRVEVVEAKPGMKYRGLKGS